MAKRKKNRPGIYIPPIKSRSTARAPHPHGGKPNPSGLLPAKVRINPRTGKVQVFVTPKVAAQVKAGNKRNPSVGARSRKYFNDRRSAVSYAHGLSKVKTPAGWPKLPRPVIKKAGDMFVVDHSTWKDD